MKTKGYLGIDAGTQGLSAMFTNENMEVLATGEAGYEMVTGLGDGCYEQSPYDWEAALKLSMADLQKKLMNAQVEADVLAIGISGQMHGEVCVDVKNQPLGSVRLWCDARNDQEGQELTELFGVKMPKRITAARWLWTIRNRCDQAEKTSGLTTPSGWIHHRLTGDWMLGIGDAAGMFPIDQATLDYDQERLQKFDELVANTKIKALKELLPAVKKAGDDAGTLNQTGSEILGLNPGIPVAAAEGDQPAALAGSLIADAGVVSVSFGTSVCANSVGDRSFHGVNEAVDHFCAPDGKPINMVWLRNGTTFMNTVFEMYGQVLGGDRGDAFAKIAPLTIAAAPDCGGLLALPFMDDEPGLNVERGGTALFVGINDSNASPGNFTKAALLATMFNLRLGSEILDQQGFPRTKLVLSGGLTKTPEFAQILADVFDVPVELLESAEEGTAWGAALLAKFRNPGREGKRQSWSEFLADCSKSQSKTFNPIAANVKMYRDVLKRYRRLIGVQSDLDQSLV